MNNGPMIPTSPDPLTDDEPLTDEQRALARQFLNPTSRQISPASIGFPEGLPTKPDYYHRSWIWLYATARMIASGDYTPELLVPEAPLTEDEQDRRAWELRQMFAEQCRQLAAPEDSDE